MNEAMNLSSEVPMEMQKNALTPQDKARLLRAMEEYLGSGMSTVVCDQCRTLIKFTKTSPTSWAHPCECGKYKGTLRGL